METFWGTEEGKGKKKKTNKPVTTATGPADAPSATLLLKTRLPTDPQVNVLVQLSDCRSLKKTLAANGAELLGPWRHLW